MNDGADSPPPSSHVGARVRIKAEHQQEVENLFSAAGLVPFHNEVQGNGDVSYWFGSEQLNELRSSGVLERIPLEYWAYHGVVVSPTKR